MSNANPRFGNPSEVVRTGMPVVRRAMLLLVAAAIGALALLAVPQTASAVDATLVSNTGQGMTGAGYKLTRTFPKKAQAFTTGSDSMGYNITSIGIRFDSIFSPETAAERLTATINAAGSDGNPGDSVCTLTHPASYVADSVNTYGVPSSCGTFAANTTYFLVLALDSSLPLGGWIELRAMYSGEEDAGAAAGWAIDDYRRLLPGARPCRKP